MIKKYLQEPLLHFLVLGGFIFLLYAYQNDGFTPEEQKITISQAKIDQLSYIWQKKQMRKPTADELQQMIEGEVYNEIMSREALKLGLDKEDGLIRRRLVQKMSFVSANLAALVEPSEAQLKAYMHAHKEVFSSPVRISFRVQSNLMLNKINNNMSQWDVSRNFGREFAKTLFALPVGKWSEEIASAYGPVRVFVKEKSEATILPFSDIKVKLKEAWQRDEQKKLEKRFYEDLKKMYDIEIGK